MGGKEEGVDVRRGNLYSPEVNIEYKLNLNSLGSSLETRRRARDARFMEKK